MAEATAMKTVDKGCLCNVGSVILEDLKNDG